MPTSLYKHTNSEALIMGPVIPEQFRNKIEQLFEEQLSALKKQKQEKLVEEDQMFSSIFSMFKSKKEGAKTGE